MRRTSGNDERGLESSQEQDSFDNMLILLRLSIFKAKIFTFKIAQQKLYFLKFTK